MVNENLTNFFKSNYKSGNMEQKERRSLDVWQFSHQEAGSPGQGRTAGGAVIIFVLKGSILVTTEAHQRTVSAGEMFLLPPGCTYSYKIVADTQTVSCRFLPEMLADILPVRELVCLCQHVGNGLSVLNICQPCFRFLRLLEYYRETGIDGEKMQTLKQKEFFCLLLSLYNKVELAGFLRPVMDEKGGFRSFVTGNWKKVRNVEELAAMANLSTSGFMKKFRRCFNESPYKWMVRQKAECVREEIVSGKSPLKEIAERYHFASYSHFCTFCKIQYGVLPRVLWSGKKEGDLQK